MTYRDPAWLVQRAWSEFRLPELQALITATIADLQALTPPELLGRELPPSLAAGTAPDPVKEALCACGGELREACGMTDSKAQRAEHYHLVRLYMTQQPLAWSELFVEALDKYRSAASAALLVTFNGKSL
ncbi:MAG TPA: hypothetical protein VJU61_15000 [Polyangiaceae bacterium]|nr:hypothetical protein [Polyangiaceae bacterium]